MWELILVVLLPPLILNLLKWRTDVERIRELSVSSPTAEVADRSASGGKRVSFLIAAWNEESAIRPCLEAIRRLPYPDLEVVLCGGGTDRTWEVANALADSRLILLRQFPGEGKQKALERCLEKSTGEIVYLLDADCRVTAAAFDRLVGPILAGKEEAVTSCPCAPLPEQRDNAFVASQCASRAYTAIYHDRYARGLWGANTALTRRALERAGGFACPGRAGGDYHLGRRLLGQGIRIRYQPEASFQIAFHTGVTRYLRQQARWLRNVAVHGMRFRAYRQVASTLRTSLLGFAMLGVPLVALGLAWTMGASSPAARLCAAFWALAYWHAVLSRVRYCGVAARWLGIRIPRRAIAMLPVYLLLDFAAWTLPLAQYARREWRQNW